MRDVWYCVISQKRVCGSDRVIYGGGGTVVGS